VVVTFCGKKPDNANSHFTLLVCLSVLNPDNVLKVLVYFDWFDDWFCTMILSFVLRGVFEGASGAAAAALFVGAQTPLGHK